jgi:hypothetical protein
MIKWKLQVPGTGCLKAEASRGAALGKLLSTAGTGGAPEQLPAHRKLREKRLCQRDVSMLYDGSWPHNEIYACNGSSGKCYMTKIKHKILETEWRIQQGCFTAHRRIAQLIAAHKRHHLFRTQKYRHKISNAVD